MSAQTAAVIPHASADEKYAIEGIEDVEQSDKPDEGRQVVVTAEDDKRIRRKTDRYLLSLLVWVYFLQIYDKTVFGYGNTYGLSTDLGLVKRQYSLLSSMTSIATLAWQPFSAYIIVRVNHRYFMTVCVFCWGTAAACMAASNGYGSILACRFLLGLFEAANIPLFSMITSTWYRRSEQPLRVCAWFIQNSSATIIAALISYGFGHIESESWRPWQSIYLSAGLITVFTAPLIWFRLPADYSEAKFFENEYEREQAIERLRANQTGGGSRNFRWTHVKEMFMDPKSWVFAALVCIPNMGAHVANTFGPTLIKGFGFEPKVATLLNIPFGVMQAIGIFFGSYGAYRFKYKSIPLVVLTLVALAGAIMLYIANTKSKVQLGLALAGYYLGGALFGVSPVVYSWTIANVGGQTKKSTMLSFMNIGTATGQMTGPLLLNAVDAPRYLPGLRSLMISQGLLVCCVGLQVVVIYLSNKRHRARRAAAGKTEQVHDISMDRNYNQVPAAGASANNAGDQDLTDWENEDFVYVY
ncbi:hypothetical protein I317_06713 [Kwoniella heveanensis CBS 569]|uniref:Major facilitator superfamily (MFS) profile domain-containing protein n=1 Tax=Kwoniella heveanensis BCC8398 TaxID=1296120 RepID=A0A1B9GLZ8_9TREE|nr:hypothetical protein I316_06387 [Kwoniella heveanensis BCC8398]OCF39495.1 hypothetical protein I317_06713 [Kwoniella heveanensis CBS 569]